MTDNRCTLPWMYPTEVLLTTNMAATCCKTPRVPMGSTGALTTQMIDIRTAILANERHKDCSRCWAVDDAGGPSQRRRYSEHFYRPIEWDRLTPTDPIRHLSVLFSNKCQMQCFYCNEQASSMWEAKRKIIKVQQEHMDLKDVVDLENLEEIHITGGEPLLENKCIDFLMALPFKSTRKLGVVTNLSYGKATMDKLLAIIERHPNLAISCSLDAIGDNFTRKHFNWDLWSENFKVLAKGFNERQPQGARYLHINIVVSIFNYKKLGDIIKYVVEWRRNNVNVTYDLSQVALDQPGSLASAPVSFKDRIQISTDYSIFLTERERKHIWSHNRMLEDVEYSAEVDIKTQALLREYSGD
jgi:organic radical activating enzyme